MAAGAIITWYDDRLGSTNSDIYAQRINAAGNIQWTIDGVAITTAMQSQVSPTITSDGLGGAIITWNSDSVFVQLINNAGNVMWDINGIEFLQVQQADLKLKLMEQEELL